MSIGEEVDALREDRDLERTIGREDGKGRKDIRRVN
jgi:hypothetical protein